MCSFLAPYKEVSVKRKRFRYWAAFAIAATIALVGAGSAYSVPASTYANEFLYNGMQRNSGWCPCWYATDVTKDPDATNLGFINDNQVKKWETVWDTYGYTDVTELQIWGYKHAYIRRVSPAPYYGAYHHAVVCEC
jgi:hypothetical protein